MPHPKSHDHCGPERSCAACPRGLACGACNKIIGFARDDPHLLVKIATALTSANKKAQARIAAAPTQNRLFD